MHLDMILIFTFLQQRGNLEITKKVMPLIVYLIHLSVQVIYETFTNAVTYDPILGNGELLWEQ
uniref:Uncharacterized protein n=1 Tax=Arundo donax TaxID=35708 RepID=A0A0A8YBX7_ARUDO